MQCCLLLIYSIRNIKENLCTEYFTKNHGSKRGLGSPPPRQGRVGGGTGVVPPPPPRQPHTPIHFGGGSSQQTGTGHGTTTDRSGAAVGGADPSGVETVSNGGGGFTPGSAFDTDIDR